MLPIITRTIRTVTALAAVATIAAGLWALISPHSFFVNVAPFPPYSEHLVHDLGAFQIGLGGCLVAGLLVRDGLLAVLVGNALGALAHLGTHVIDRAHGGHHSDPFTIGAIAVIMIALAIGRWLTVRGAAS
jgi:hypothetical protein